MAIIELEYEERADGLLYPILDMGTEKLHQLGIFGTAKLEYLHSEKFEYYRELLLLGKLAEHCEEVDERGYEQSEKLQQHYLSKYDLSAIGFEETYALRTQAKQWAEEIMIAEICGKG